jgi:hypothetical protein
MALPISEGNAYMVEKKQIVNKVRKNFLKIGCIKFMDFDLINK